MAFRPSSLQWVAATTTMCTRRILISATNSDLAYQYSQNLPSRISRRTLAHHSTHAVNKHNARLDQTVAQANKQALRKLKKVPKLLMLHNPYSVQSRNILQEIHEARKAWPNQGLKKGPALDFELEVKTRLPTIEELQDVYALLNASNWSIFLDSQDGFITYRTHPTNARSLLESIKIIQEKEREHFHNNPPGSDPDNPEFQCDPSHPLFGTDRFLWPVVVCWDEKLISMGFNGVKGVRRIFKKFAERQTGFVVPTPKEKSEAAKQARLEKYESQAVKEVSPSEDDTLRWFNETSPPDRRARQPPSHSARDR